VRSKHVPNSDIVLSMVESLEEREEEREEEEKVGEEEELNVGEKDGEENIGDEEENEETDVVLAGDVDFGDLLLFHGLTGVSVKVTQAWEEEGLSMILTVTNTQH